jgi:hypothetical protein
VEGGGPAAGGSGKRLRSSPLTHFVTNLEVSRALSKVSRALTKWSFRFHRQPNGVEEGS